MASSPPPQPAPPPHLLQLLAAPRLLAGAGAAAAAVHVGSRKALAILALLALDGPSPRERLATLLWPEADSAGGRRNLRRELFRLRELGVPLQEAADGAMALDARLAVDALQLLHEQRLPASSGLALEGLDGVGSPELDAWLQRWRAQLAHQHGQVLAQQAEAVEQRGDLPAALALQLQRLAADACNEPAALQVMRLQAALGDRAAALQTGLRLADALRDQLDISPSEPVLALAATLRQQLGQPEGAPPSPARAALPPDGPRPLPGTGLPAVVPFVPRVPVQARIHQAWARGQRVYLHGAAGAGKTRLACELAAARGPWLRVACEPQDAELPYASVVRLLRALREAAPDEPLPGWVLRELAQLMPELGPAPQALATDEARQRLLAAVAEAWRLLVRDNFSVIVLDDWQWGDAASVELWSRLDDPSPGPATADAVAWIIGYRSAQLPPLALQRQRADVDNGRGVRVALEGLDEAEVLALTRALSGSTGGQLFSQRLHGATEGNPFFLLETLRHLFDQQLLVADARGWSTPFDEHTESYAELPVPASVRSAVQTRVRALGEPMLRLLELACLCQGELDVRLLAGASRQDDEAVIDLLAHAQAAQLLQETRSGWRFAHDLVRQSLQQGLSPARQRLLHERLARQLEQAGAASALVAARVAARVAAHWEAAQLPATAVRWRVLAAESALRVHGLQEALSHYAHALADGARGADAVAVQLACAQVHIRRTDRAAADTALAAALQAAAELAAADPVHGAAEVLRVQLARADHLRETDRDAAALALLDALAPELAQAAPTLRAQGLRSRGMCCMLQGRHADALALLSQAVGWLEPLPEARPQLADLQLQLATAAVRQGDLEASGRLARRAVAVHESIDAPIGLSHSLVRLGLVCLHLGEREQALAVLERARALAQRCGNVPTHRGAILNLVKIHVDVGDTAAAGRLLDEGEALAPGFEHRRAEQAFREARYYLHYLRGEVPQAFAAADRLLAFARQGIGPQEHVGACHLVVDLYLLQGDLARARALIDEAQALGDAMQAGHEYALQQDLKRAWLALAEGRPADALQQLRQLPQDGRLLRLEDRFAGAWIGCAAARALGDAAGARQWLCAVSPNAEVAVDMVVFWLLQCLALGHEDGADLPQVSAAALRARELLAQGLVPALLAAPLQEAVNACSTLSS